MKPIKVLHLIESGGLYGAEVMLLNLVEEQLNQGIRPLIFSTGTLDESEKAIEAEAKNRNLPIKAIRVKAGFNIAKGFEIIRFARKEGYNLLHSHGYKYNILLGLIPLWFRRIPIVTTIHGYAPASRFSKISVYQWLDKKVIRYFAKVVFVNRFQLEQEFFRGCRLDNYAIINNGINVEREVEHYEKGCKYIPDDKLREFLSDASPVIGSIGRLSTGKGVQDLIQAFHKLIQIFPFAKLVIAGEGPYRNELESLVDELELREFVIFVGYTSKTYYYLSRFDIFVLPSHSEGLPMVLLEAMIAEKRIIATHVGGIPEALQNGAIGDLVQSKSIDDLACSLIEVSKELSTGRPRLNLQDTSLRQVVIDNFSSQLMAQKYNNIYHQVVGILR